MNKRLNKKYMNRRYKIIEGKGNVVHGFTPGTIVMWTGKTSNLTETRLMIDRDGRTQYVPGRDLKRIYKKFE